VIVITGQFRLVHGECLGIAGLHQAVFFHMGKGKVV